jgi:hypothetical protein
VSLGLRLERAAEVHVDGQIAAALVGGAITIIGGVLVAIVPLWWHKRQKKDVQVLKLAYVKVVHLAPLDGPPAYTAHVPRPAGTGTDVEVFDEVRLFRLNKFAISRSEFKSRDRSSGIVDLLMLYPYNEKLVFPDKAAERVMGHIEQIVRRDVDTVLSMSTYYNGLGKDQEDWAIQMEHQTEEARLIVDLSSVPGRHQIVRSLPRGSVRRGDEESSRGLAEPRPGVYSLDASNLSAGDVLRIDLTLHRLNVELPSIGSGTV